MLNRLRSIGLDEASVILLADRGLMHEQLLHYLPKLQWHFRLRLPGDPLLYLVAWQPLLSGISAYLQESVASSTRCQSEEQSLGQYTRLWSVSWTLQMIPGLL